MEYARVRVEPPWMPADPQPLPWTRSPHPVPGDKSTEKELQLHMEERMVPLGGDNGEFVGYPFSGMPIELSVAFANIDSVVDFTERRGGMVVPSELGDYYAVFSGSFALEALAYTLLRFPMARTLIVRDDGNPHAQYKGERGYGTLPSWVPPLAARPEEPRCAIAKRFGEGVDLFVCDLGFDLAEMELILSTSGTFIAVCGPEPDERSIAEISMVAARFEEWSFFHPFGFLGHRAVVCGRKVRSYTPVDFGSVRRKVSTVVDEWKSSEPHVWWDRNMYDHERCKAAWNIA